uniref:Ubiquinol-cytochrome c reductase complex 6.7 kDa protein n=1 Tax=Leersia perrieri TaxID=77586 RepID=A0A0D9WF25_9ORYZ
MPAAQSTSRLFRFLPPHRRPQGTDITAVAGWTVAAVATAIWLVQPFDWIKKTFLEKQEPEEGRSQA